MLESVWQLTNYWMLALFIISPILNIYYISKGAKSSKGRKLIRLIGGSVHFLSLSLLITTFLIIITMDVSLSFENTLEMIFSFWFFAVALISPLINIYYRVKYSAAVSRKILMGILGIISYSFLLFLLFISIFVSV